MKGIVFTEFLDMVEARFTPEVADRMITAAALPSDGAYTSGSIMYDDAGRVQGIVCIAQDITERKQAEELRRQREAAEEANRAKSTLPRQHEP